MKGVLASILITTHGLPSDLDEFRAEGSPYELDEFRAQPEELRYNSQCWVKGKLLVEGTQLTFEERLCAPVFAPVFAAFAHSLAQGLAHSYTQGFAHLQKHFIS